jgi:hypothetical protein
MATYILLANFTDQGIRKVKDSARADAFKEMEKKCGATVKDVFWTPDRSRTSRNRRDWTDFRHRPPSPTASRLYSRSDTR